MKKNALYSLHSFLIFWFFTYNVCFLEATLLEKIIKVLILVIEASQNCTIKDCNPLLNTITVMPLHKKRCILPFGHSKYLLENSNHFSWLFQKKKRRKEFGGTINGFHIPLLISKMQCRFCNASFRYLPILV